MDKYEINRKQQIEGPINRGHNGPLFIIIDTDTEVHDPQGTNQYVDVTLRCKIAPDISGPEIKPPALMATRHTTNLYDHIGSGVVISDPDWLKIKREQGFECTLQFESNSLSKSIFDKRAPEWVGQGMLILSIPKFK